MGFNLKRLCHPSGLPPRVINPRGKHSCPCGCNPQRAGKAFELSAEQMGLKTHTIDLIRKWNKEKRARENAARPKVPSPKPWKGAKVSVGEVELRVYGRLKTFPAQIYTHPNGAVAKIRIGKRVPGINA